MATQPESVVRLKESYVRYRVQIGISALGALWQLLSLPGAETRVFHVMLLGAFVLPIVLAVHEIRSTWSEASPTGVTISTTTGSTTVARDEISTIELVDYRRRGRRATLNGDTQLELVTKSGERWPVPGSRSSDRELTEEHRAFIAAVGAQINSGLLINDA